MTIIDEVKFDAEEYVGEQFIVDESGVTHLKETRGGEIEHIPVCSTLKIAAVSRDKNGQDWGKLLVFDDPTGTKKQYHLRSSALMLRPMQVVADLIHEGLRLGSHSTSKTRLLEYLHALKSPVQVLSSAQPGWVGNHCFLLPDQSFGQIEVIWSSDVKTHNFRCAGTVGEWRKHVASLCVGNSRLMFGASIGFAAPMMRMAHIEGGGFHICGESSSGKSTALQLASSIYGTAEEGNKERYLINWDTTKGALELMADSLNDCLLACDELG